MRINKIVVKYLGTGSCCSRVKSFYDSNTDDDIFVIGSAKNSASAIMMEMEISSELGKDAASDDGDRGSDRSSADSEYCTLEEDYAKVLAEMKGNESLAAYQTEYTKLFEALYVARRNEKRLVNECEELRRVIEENDERLQTARKESDADKIYIEKLGKEIENALKLADAAHTREQQAQETIDTLRLTTVKLNQEIEQKNKQLEMDEENMAASKQKEGLLKERERMLNEIETLRQRVANMTTRNDELERTNSQIDQEITELRNTVETQTSEFSKERRAREQADESLTEVREELRLQTIELQKANSMLKSATNNAVRLENIVKEQKTTNENLQKRIDKFMLKSLAAQTDMDNLTRQLEEANKDLADKAKKLRSSGSENIRLRNEIDKLTSQNEAAWKRIYKAEAEKSKAEEELKQQEVATRSMETDVKELSRKVETDRRTIETLQRERDAQAKTVTSLKSANRKHILLSKLDETTRIKLETKIENLTRENESLGRGAESMEKERTKHMCDVQLLNQQIDDQTNELKRKQTEISEFKKRLNEAETKFRQQQNLFESVRADRNSCNKSLIEAQDEVCELKQKLKMTNDQIEQFKEEVEIKEKSLIKGEFLLGKAEKEKISLKTDLQAARKDVSDLRREIEEQKLEEKRLRHNLRAAENDVSRQKKEIEMIMNEKDILGTQLVRRNDELGVQYDRLKLCQTTIMRGESEYMQRLDDIRLLKLEVKKLRTEKVLLAKTITNMSDLRQEIFHLDRDLTREKLKVMALEQEVQNPLNIHRWRKLEGSDPDTYELLLKIQLLQRRILKMCVASIEKEKKMKQGEKLYAGLRAVLSKQPGPEVIVSLQETRKALRDRGNKMKCLIAELNASESQTSEYKFDLERLSAEMCMLKSKYYEEKRKNQKHKEIKPKDSCQTILPSVLPVHKRFYGGGFNVSSPTPMNGYALESGSVNE